MAITHLCTSLTLGRSDKSGKGFKITFYIASGNFIFVNINPSFTVEMRLLFFLSLPCLYTVFVRNTNIQQKTQDLNKFSFLQALEWQQFRRQAIRNKYPR
jgi:hypothetical protein